MKRIGNQEATAYVVIALVAVLYLYVLFTFVSPMPIHDDYSTVLGFLELYTQTNDPLQKLKLLFTPNADHRIVIPMAVIWAAYQLTSKADFVLLIALGNIGWLLCVWLFWRYTTRTLQLSATAFVPIAVAMFSFAPASLMTWATGSLQQYWQLFFALAAIDALTRNRFVAALAWAVAATLTSGGGFVLFPLFGLYYLWHRNLRRLAVVAAVGAGVGWIYFVFLPYRFAPLAPYTDTLRYLIDTVLYALTFLGNWAAHFPAAAWVGGITTALALWRWNVTQRRVPFVAWSILFVVGIAFLAAKARAINGAPQALASRYSIYAIVLFVLTYLAFMSDKRFRTATWRIATAVAVFMYALHWAEKIPLFAKRHHEAGTQLAFFLPAFAVERLQRAQKGGYFSAQEHRILLPGSVATLPKRSQPFAYRIALDRNITLTHTAPQATLSLFRNLPFALHLYATAHDAKGRNAYAVVLSVDTYKQVRYFPHYKGRRTLFAPWLPSQEALEATLSFPPLPRQTHTLHIGFVSPDIAAVAPAATLTLQTQPLRKIRTMIPQNLPLLGAVDRIDRDDTTVTIQGWFTLRDNPRRDMFLVGCTDTDTCYVAEWGKMRPDVARALGDTRYANSGFTLRIPQTNRPPRSIRFYLLSGDHQTLYARTKSYPLPKGNP